MTTLTINLPQTSYPLTIEPGSADNVLNYYQTNNCFVMITDEGVPPSVVERIQKQLNPVTTITLPSGESTKSIETYHRIVATLLKQNISKTTTLVALGGGVIGDLTGFVASTYYRGINYIQIPTTLLSMVDSSIGGKTAINMQNVKNVVGTFYHPSAVIIDPNLLNTLPNRHIANGMAEVIKMALIGDADFAKALLNDIPIPTLIERAIRIKKQIVEKDPRDTHERHLLNHGHTIAHAIEALEPNLLHGECVAIGMKKMAKGELYETLLDDLLTKYDLTIQCTLKKDQLYNHILHDKKIKHDTLNIALIKNVGKGYIKSIKIEDIKSYL